MPLRPSPNRMRRKVKREKVRRIMYNTPYYALVPLLPSSHAAAPHSAASHTKNTDKVHMYEVKDTVLRIRNNNVLQNFFLPVLKSPNSSKN